MGPVPVNVPVPVPVPGETNAEAVYAHPQTGATNIGNEMFCFDDAKHNYPRRLYCLVCVAELRHSRL